MRNRAVHDLLLEISTISNEFAEKVLVKSIARKGLVNDAKKILVKHYNIIILILLYYSIVLLLYYYILITY